MFCASSAHEIQVQNEESVMNLIRFNTDIGQQKPENIIHSDAECPFCDVEHLTDIIETDGDIILLKNKYNVIETADQFVIIEGKDCYADMPSYSGEHMHRLIRLGLRHWKEMLSSGKYSDVLFFKNYGPLSGGTIRHPHMQLIGFPEINGDLFFLPEEMQGLVIDRTEHVELNISTYPRIGFGELNIVPEIDSNPDILADYIQIAVDYLMNHFNKRCNSYNIFFYHKGEQIYVKLLPRFATSPYFIGYNIHLLPSNVERIAEEMKRLYF